MEGWDREGEGGGPAFPCIHSYLENEILDDHPEVQKTSGEGERLGVGV